MAAKRVINFNRDSLAVIQSLAEQSKTDLLETRLIKPFTVETQFSKSSGKA